MPPPELALGFAAGDELAAPEPGEAPDGEAGVLLDAELAELSAALPLVPDERESVR